MGMWTPRGPQVSGNQSFQPWVQTISTRQQVRGILPAQSFGEHLD